DVVALTGAAESDFVAGIPLLTRFSDAPVDVAMKLRSRDQLLVTIEKILDPDAKDKNGRNKLVKRGMLRRAQMKVRAMTRLGTMGNIF
ncbi:unnamed protein product, partial [Amoebophrya sp. A120]